MNESQNKGNADRAADASASGGAKVDGLDAQTLQQSLIKECLRKAAKEDDPEIGLLKVLIVGNSELVSRGHGALSAAFMGNPASFYENREVQKGMSMCVSGMRETTRLSELIRSIKASKEKAKQASEARRADILRPMGD